MKKTTNKIVLIGAGAVGTSFLYSAMNQGIGNEFGIIDINPKVAKGNELDLEDAFPVISSSVNEIKAGGYEMIKDADVLVITAGRPQLQGETRLEMVKDNALIMKDIAEKVKSNGFKGITIIASNPVDVMTTVFQNVTGFNSRKVISSGTSLDSSRLQVELAKRTGFNSQTIQAYVIGEHGDSSVSTFANARIAGLSGKEIFEEVGLNEDDLSKIHEGVWRKAYEIIERKRATYYGIGANLANITRSILNNDNSVISVGAKLEGQYGIDGFYFGTPCVINASGISKILEFPISKSELKQAKLSAEKIEAAVKEAISVL